MSEIKNDEQYDVVVAVIEELQNSSEKITVRNVMSRTSGSTAKITKYIQQWRESQVVPVNEVAAKLSEEYLAAIQKLITEEQIKLVRTTTEALTKQLAEKDQALNEIVEINERLETDVENLKTTLKKGSDEYIKLDSDMLGLKKEIDGVTKQHAREVDLLTKQIISLEAKLKEANDLVYGIVRSTKTKN